MSNQTILRVDRVILPARSGCLISRLFERQLDLALLFARLMLALRDRLDGRLNAERLQQPHDLGSHSIVDP
ncbi:hypothetical protein NKH58_29660 [Mesorhizobium australicum]|uniref:hypothetical protein n=1 Tax=Mesorhizobium australicum TaxID=536018 RepID=UPI00333DB95B